MNSRNVFRSLAGLAVLLVAALTLSVAVSPAAKSKNVYWISLAGGSSQAPHRVYFTASSGGYMAKIEWKRWGKRKTVGRGTFGTTAPCNGSPCPKGPARLVLRKPVKCHPAFGAKKGKTVRVYRRGTLYYPDSDGTRLVANISDRTGWGVCSESFR